MELIEKRENKSVEELEKDLIDIIACLDAYEDSGLTPDQIMELVERNTEKTPEEFDAHWYKCPTCGKYAGGLKGNFCYNCGQRLRWEE